MSPLERILTNSRILNLLGFLSCTAMMGYALYAEYKLFLMPCPLCVFQRMAVIVMGIVFLVAAIHHPGGSGRVWSRIWLHHGQLSV